MVNTQDRKSDTPRESLAHQINVQRTYMKAIKSGKLKFGQFYDPSLKSRSKDQLLSKLKKADKELMSLLRKESNLRKRIVVPWNKDGIGTIQMLWAMDSHEILHTGWNIALMDHLNIPRFEKLKKTWG